MNRTKHDTVRYTPRKPRSCGSIELVLVSLRQILSVHVPRLPLVQCAPGTTSPTARNDALKGRGVTVSAAGAMPCTPPGEGECKEPGKVRGYRGVCAVP